VWAHLEAQLSATEENLESRDAIDKLNENRSLLRDAIEEVFYAYEGNGDGLPLIGVLQEGVREQAARYLERPSLHARSVTRLLLIAVIDSELIPLQRDIVGFFAFHAVGRAKFIIPWLPWIPFLVSLAMGWFTVAIIVGIWPGLRLIKRWRLSRHACRLQLVREEVATGAFDADALADRLREYERKGLWVPSILYGLLKAWPVREGGI
jgi:hypothetical protein